MYCMKCGKKLPDDAMFCYSCGAEVNIPDVTDESLKKRSAEKKIEVADEKSSNITQKSSKGNQGKGYSKRVTATNNGNHVQSEARIRDRFTNTISRVFYKQGELNIRLILYIVTGVVIVSAAIALIVGIKGKQRKNESVSTYNSTNESISNDSDVIVEDNSEDYNNEPFDLNNISAGQYVMFGRYEQDNDLNNGMEPIEWEVLATEDGKALLVSKYVLEIARFNDYTNNQYDNTWATCSLRYWLNDWFYNNGFSEEERNNIISTHISDAHEKGICESDDYIFCFSTDEILDYFVFDKWIETYYTGEAYSKELVTESTPYASQRVGYGRSTLTEDRVTSIGYPPDMIGKSGTRWWLRNTNYNGFVQCVDQFGKVQLLTGHSISSVAPTSDGFGVRPALWVNAPGCTPGRAYIKENFETSESITSVEGSLTEAVLAEVCGHYEDGHGDSIDLFDTDHMVRFIQGGNQSHTYDEKICGFEQLDNGYLLKVEWDGEKYTYLYTKENGTEYLLPNFDEGWNPGTNPYNYMEGVQEYAKISAEASSNSAKVEPKLDSKQYYAGICDIKKEGDDYYIYPKEGQESFWPVEGGNGMPFTKGVKISKDAQIGMATSFYTTSNGDFDEGHFTYEYYDFYQKADEFLSNKRWFDRDDGLLCFEVDGNEMPLWPIVAFDEHGDIDLFLEYYSP